MGMGMTPDSIVGFEESDLAVRVQKMGHDQSRDPAADDSDPTGLTLFALGAHPLGSV